MKVTGRVHNGVVVLERGHTLPEGAKVTVLCDKVRARRTPEKKKRVEFPLVHSKHPGTLDLTNERTAEILNEEDFCGLAKFMRPGF